MSFVNEVNGIGAHITLRPCRCKGRMTLLQQDPSAHAPCTKTIAEPCGKAFTFLLRFGSQYRLPGGTSSSRRQFHRRASPARNVQCQGTEPSRRVSPSERPPLRLEQKKDRSCPRSRAEVVWTCENIPGISDKASRSTRNPETNRAGFPCFPAARAKPCPTCTTQVECLPDSLRLGCTASVSLRLSKCFDAVCPDSVPWVQPSTFGLGPKHRPGLLRMRSRSAKQSQ